MNWDLLHRVWAPGLGPRKLCLGVQTLCMALLLIAWTTGPVRADCPAAPIAHPDDMAISFLAANGVQAASASLLASSVKEGTLVYDDTANNLQVCNGTNWVAVGTGTGGIAGGGASEVQFRDSGTGAFAADSAFRYDPAAHILTISPNPATLSQAPFTNTVLHLSNVDGSAPRLLMEAFSNGSTTTPNVSMRSANGTGVAPLALRNEDILGQLTFTGHNGTSFALARSAIRGTATEDWTPTANGADLRFHTGEYRTGRLVLQAFDQLADGTLSTEVAQPASGTVKEGKSSRLADGAWSRPLAELRGETGAMLVALLKAMETPLPARHVRLAAILALEPRLLHAQLTREQSSKWLHLIGDEAKPLPKGTPQFVPPSDQNWGAVVRGLRTRGALIEDAKAGTWGPGKGLDKIETGGWPDGRAGFVLDIIRASGDQTLLATLPAELKRWLDAEAA